jgi:hypothetical protein
MKTNLKRGVTTFVAGMMAAQSLAGTAFAQTRQVVTPGMVPMVTANPGAYEIRSQDTTKLLQDILDRNNRVHDIDRQYFQSTISSIDSAYNEYMKLIVSGEFKQMSDRSMYNQESIEVTKYLALVNKINELKLSIESKIFALTSMKAENLPSAVQYNVAGSTQSVQGTGNLNFAPLTNFYNERMAAVTAIGANYGFKVMFPNLGTPKIVAQNSGMALTPRFDVPLFSAQEIDALQAKILELRDPDGKVVAMMDDQANQLKRLIQAFVTNFGTTERYRFKSTGDEDEFKNAYRQIVEIFWTRSYLRAKYGVRLGAVQPAAYQKRWLNIDKFTVATEALRGFRQERALDETEIANARQNMHQILKVLDERSAAIVGEKADASLLVRANALMTFLGGNSQTAESLLMVMRLVAADIKEEEMLASGGGLARLYDFYQNRYQSTDETKGIYLAMKCGYDQLLSDKARAACPKTAFADVGSQAGGGLRATFNSMNLSLRTESVKINQALEIEKQIRLALLAAGGEAVEAVDDRAGSL